MSQKAEYSQEKTFSPYTGNVNVQSNTSAGFLKQTTFYQIFQVVAQCITQNKGKLIRYINQSRLHPVNPFNNLSCTWPHLRSVSHSSSIKHYIHLDYLEPSIQASPFSVNLCKSKTVRKTTTTMLLYTRPLSLIQIIKHRTQLRRLIFHP